MEHLTTEDLARLAAGDSSSAAERDASAHLEVCVECRRSLEVFRRDEDLLDELRGAAGSEDVAVARPSVDGFDGLVEVHRGGQGVVYRAVREGTDERVAIKVLIGGRYASSRDRFRFEQEIEVASSLDHPNIVTVVESGRTEDGFPYCVMPFVEGRYLDDDAKARSASARDSVRLVRRVVEAVAYAHRHGVVHRDLKPGNVVIDAEGEPHVLDFGLAANVGDRRAAAGRLTRTGEFVGTLAYAAPEQFSLSGPPIGPAADVYSLGVCLYEILAGHNPNRSRVAVGVSGAVECESLPPLPKTIDEDLRRIVRKAVEVDPQHRYASAGEFGRDLDAFLEGMPIRAEGARVLRVLGERVRRHRIPIAVAALLVVVLGGSAVFTLRERLRREEQQLRAERIQSVFDDVLAATRPQRMGAEARVTDVLRESARRIESTLANAPDAQAAVQFAIGETFARSSMFEPAVVHLRSAVERYRALPRARLELARALARLGRVHTVRGEQEAVECLEESLAIRRRALGGDHPEVAGTLCDLGHALESLSDGADRQRALECYERATESLRRRGGGEEQVRRPLATACFRLARAHERRGRFEEAGTLYREAIDAFEVDGPSLGDESDATAIAALDGYSRYLRSVGREREAEATIERAVAVTRRWFDVESAASLLRRHMRVDLDEGDPVSAETFSRHALVAALEGWAAKRPRDEAGLGALARRLEATSGPADADLWLDAFRYLREFEGTGSYELAGWMRETADVLAALERPEAAESLLRESLTIHCRVYGESCPIRIDGMLDLAELLTDRAAFDEAAEAANSALAMIAGSELEEKGKSGPMKSRAQSILRRCGRAEADRVSD